MQPSSRSSNSFSLSQFAAVLIFFLGAATILFHLGTSGLLETSEGRYASVGRAMLDSGNWLVPVHNGLRHLTKPPLTYWASAMGMKLFGIDEFGARFFLAFAAGLTGLGCFFIARTMFDFYSGIVAALILICSLFFQIQFRGLTTDPFLTMFETFMVLGFLRYIQTSPDGKIQRWLLFFWFNAALAMLTKGPPGLLPLLGLIPAAIYAGRGLQVKNLFKSVAGWTIFLVLGLGWYLYLAVKIPGLLQYFLVDETLKRVASSEHQRSAPFYLFLILLPAGIFPWTGLFFRGLASTVRNLKKDFNCSFLFFWLFVPLMVFSLSRSKLAAYVLPLLVPVSIIAAAATVELFRNFKQHLHTLRFHLRLIGIELILIGLTMLVYALSGELAADSLNSSLKFCGSVWIFLGIFLLAQTFYGNRLFAFSLICFVAPTFIFFTIPGIRGNEELRPGKFMTSQWLLLRRLANLPPGQKLINIEEMIEGWYFYTGRNPITWNVSRIVRFDEEAAKKLVLEGDEQLRESVDIDSMLVLRKKDLARVSAILNSDLKTVASEGKWLVSIPERRFRP